MSRLTVLQVLDGKPASPWATTPEKGEELPELRRNWSRLMGTSRPNRIFRRVAKMIRLRTAAAH